MQKNWRLVLFTTFGLALFFFSQNVYAEILYEGSSQEKQFDFNGLNEIFLAITLPDDQKFLNSFESALNNKGVLKIKKSYDEILNAIGTANLWLFIALKPTKNPRIYFLELNAKTSSETIKTQSKFNGIVWNRVYIIENKSTLESDIDMALTRSIDLFLSQYFETNPNSSGKAIFYYPDPKIK